MGKFMFEVVALVIGMSVLAETPQEPVCPPAPPCPACPECPAPPAAPLPRAWTGSVGFGAVSVTGNARSLTLSLGSTLEYKATDWIFSGRASATYGESRVAGTDDVVTSAEDAALFLRADRRLTPRLSTYALAGFEADHPKSVEIRYSQELGAAYAWIDRTTDEDKLLLRTDLGFRVAEEYRYQYFPVRASVPGDYPEIIVAPRLGGALRYEINNSILFSQDLEVLPNLLESRWFVNSTSKLTAKLMQSLGFGVGYIVNYDSAPPDPKIPWDTKLAVTLDYLL
jgi:putative salt-induced outer membrane protein YdiY